LEIPCATAGIINGIVAKGKQKISDISSGPAVRRPAEGGQGGGSIR